MTDTSLNTYLCYYKGKDVTVKAATTLAAQKLAAPLLKAKRLYEITVKLACLGEHPYVHATASL